MSNPIAAASDLSQQLLKLLLIPQKVMELLAPAPVPYARCPNIRVKYIGFLQWLTVFDPRGSRGLARDVESYRDLKKVHEHWTVKELDLIAHRATGRAVLGEIAATSPRVVTILPFVEIADYGINATTNGTNASAATATGMPIITSTTRRGRPNYKNGSGSGAGSDSVIDYSATMWTEYGPARLSGTRGPGFEPDEVLIHELVHAAREMRGVEYLLPVTGGYDTQEEFLGVVVTNIYLSEKGQTVFARNHGTGVLKHPEAFLDARIHPSPRVLLERFRLAQPAFWDALVRIGPAAARFNPVRQYDAERKAGKAP